MVDADFLLFLLLLVTACTNECGRRMKWSQRNASDSRLLRHESTVIGCCHCFHFFVVIIEEEVPKEMRMTLQLSGLGFIMDSGINFWHFAWSRIILVWF